MCFATITRRAQLQGLASGGLSLKMALFFRGSRRAGQSRAQATMAPKKSP